MRRLLPLLLAAAAAAAEPPITEVTVLPDGLIIERAGPVPAGDETVTGLPAGIDEGSLSVEVDGREADRWHLARPAALPMPRVDPAAQLRLAAAGDRAAAVRLRADLAAAAHTASRERAGAERPSPPALPGPEAVRAQIAFAADNAARSASEAQTAAAEVELARDALAAAPAPAPAAPTLHVPGMGGRTVRIRHLLPGAAWSPAWRLEVDGGGAVLVQLAVIDLDAGRSLPAARLCVATRGRADAALLPDPSVPIIGLGESLALESRRAVGRGGGSKGSESAVEAGLRSCKETLSAGSGSIATDASLVLAMLGAGYDHKTPSRYRQAVKAGVGRLAALDAERLDLPVLALAASAVAEAYGMTSDPDLRPRIEAFLASLRNRWPGELRDWLRRSGPLAGPEAAVHLLSALKACQAGGLAVGEDLASLRAIDLGRGEDADLARLFIGAFTGSPAPLIDQDTARRWIAAFDRWWGEGRIELIHHAILVAFQNGGEEWRLVNGILRDRLIALQIRGGAEDGLWPLQHYPLGMACGSAVVLQSLEIYYRYARVDGARPEPTAAPAAAGAEPAAACPWPLRLAAAHPVALGPGRQEVELRRARLAAAFTWESVPVQSPGVWRRLSAPNPWAAPLPGGPLSVVADGRQAGRTALTATAPGTVLAIDLGPDDRLRVRRTLRSSTEDGVFKRTLAMTVTCTLEAPPGFAGEVRVREPLPRPDGDLVAVALLQPQAAEGETYAARVARDPLAEAILGPATPEAVVAELRLTYPRSVRPRLEAR